MATSEALSQNQKDVVSKHYLLKAGELKNKQTNKLAMIFLLVKKTYESEARKDIKTKVMKSHNIDGFRNRDPLFFLSSFCIMCYMIRS